MIVCIDLSSRFHALGNEALENGLGGSWDYLGADLVRGPVLGSDDGGLAYGSTSSLQTLAGVLVPLFSTDIGFIHFHRTLERLRDCVKGFAEPMGHVPC